jgi:DNA polymerase-1
MPVQGTSADITKKALNSLARRLKDTEARIIGTVHDEIILEVLDSS